MDMEASPNSHPSFYKVVPAQSLHEDSLRLPKVFVGQHGNSFPNYACLKVPTGAIWKVELRKSNGHVWLDKGWREFAEFYSIEEGHLLVFKNEGGSLFHVLIFKTTGLEIIYHASDSAFTAPKVTQFEEEEEEDDDEDVDASSDDDHARPRKSHKNRRTVPLVNRYEFTGKTQVEQSGSKKTVPLSASLKQKLNCTRCKRKVLENSGLFKSEKLHFILQMNPTYVAQNSMTRIPTAHFKRYLEKDWNHHGQNEMVLRGSMGRSWRVEFLASRTFGFGWGEFLRERRGGRRRCLHV